MEKKKKKYVIGSMKIFKLKRNRGRRFIFKDAKECFKTVIKINSCQSFQEGKREGRTK